MEWLRAAIEEQGRALAAREAELAAAQAALEQLHSKAAEAEPALEQRAAALSEREGDAAAANTLAGDLRAEMEELRSAVARESKALSTWEAEIQDKTAQVRPRSPQRHACFLPRQMGVVLVGAYQRSSPFSLSSCRALSGLRQCWWEPVPAGGPAG